MNEELIFVHRFSESGDVEPFFHVNDVACRILGYPREELLRLSPLDIIAPECLDQVEGEATELSSKRHLRFRKTLVTRSGDRILVDLNSHIVEIDGTLTAFTTARDVTEEERTTALLRSQETRLRVFNEAPLDIILVLDRNGRVVSINSRGAERLGRAIGDLIGADIFEVLPPGIAAERRAHFDEVVHTGEPRIFEDHRAGQHYVNHFHPIFDDDGHVVTGVVVFGANVTDLKQAETALRQTEERFRALYQSSPDIVAVTDLRGTILDINRAAPGFDKSRVLGSSVTYYLNPDEVNAFGTAVARVVATGDPQSFEAVVTASGGEPRFWHNRVAPLRIGEMVDGLVINFTDVTERRLIERSLQDALTQLNQAINTAGLGTWTLDLESGRLEWNDQQLEIYGLTRGEFEQHIDTWKTQVHGEDREFTESRLAEVLEGRPVYGVEFRIIRPDGEVRHLEASAAPILDGEGRIVAVTGVNFDVTERKLASRRLEETRAVLEEAERIAHVGSWEWNVKTGSAYWSDEFFRIAGRDKALGPPSYESYMDQVHPDDRDWLARTIEAAVAGEGSYACEYRYFRYDNGEELTISAKGLVIVGEDGSPTSLVGSVQDITERKKVELELRTAIREVESLKDRIQAENIYLRDRIREVSPPDNLVVESRSMRGVLQQARQVADTDSAVLILGETGTGKEVIARTIHAASKRSAEALVVVNCAALPNSLVESELFGHEQGAFTGAVTRQVGRFEIADGGTLFLDEIGELPLDLQAKLLRVLESGQFQRLGSPHTVTVNVRLICATNSDLEQKVAVGAFRADLFYRLNVFPILIPPLRTRTEDIPPLVWRFVRQISERMGKRIERIPESSMEALMKYSWPGNVRELRNVIERSIISTAGDTLQVPQLQDKFRSESTSQSLAEAERSHILRVLEESGWRVRGRHGAAEKLAMNPSTLESRMRKLGISRPK